MVLFKRKRVQYVSKPKVHDDQEIWTIDPTDEIFTDYEAYLQRNDFYSQKRFICEITGRSNLTFREALRVEHEASVQLKDAFPDVLREPILRKAQFSQLARLDYLEALNLSWEALTKDITDGKTVDWIFDQFKQDFYPGENVIAMLESHRIPALIKEKVRFPELAGHDGKVERKAFTRYFVQLEDEASSNALFDETHVFRDKKLFTKNRLRSFLRTALHRETWPGAPWIIKAPTAAEFRISTEVPQHLTQEYQIRMKRLNDSGNAKKVLDRKGINGSSGQNGMAKGPVKPNGMPKLEPKPQKPAYPFQGDIAALHPAPENVNAPNLPKKYPIEDLELPPLRDGTHRPPLKYLSNSLPPNNETQISDKLPQHLLTNDTNDNDSIQSDWLGALLESWNTLNVYCEVFELDSFTFDDYWQALQIHSADTHCELLSEIHCALLKTMVNDIDDQGGQIQINLPTQLSTLQEGQEDLHDAISVAGSEMDENLIDHKDDDVALKKESLMIRPISAKSENTMTHRAEELELNEPSANWITRLRARDLHDGRWVAVVVGLLYHLSFDPRLSRICNAILAHLAPLNVEPTWRTTDANYASLDVRLRIILLQILCVKSLETKAMRAYMEECSGHMTEHRKEKNEMRRQWKTLLDELKECQDERTALQPPKIEGANDRQTIAGEQGAAEGSQNGNGNNGTEPGSALSDAESLVISDAGSMQDGSDESGPKKPRGRGRPRRRKSLTHDVTAEHDRTHEKTKKLSKEERLVGRLDAKIGRLEDRLRSVEEDLTIVDNDLREADCPRTRGLGRDRFWNRYFWLEKNAMPYAGLPDSSTAHAGYANGCIWVQGPEESERRGFIELTAKENAHYDQCFGMTVVQRQQQEEGKTHLQNAKHWAYYDDPDSLDMLIAWLDPKGCRESRLRKELINLRSTIAQYMLKRQEYLTGSSPSKEAIQENNKQGVDANKAMRLQSLASPGATTQTDNVEHKSGLRVSTRVKMPRSDLFPNLTSASSASGLHKAPNAHQYRCQQWHNKTALRIYGHVHSEAKPMVTRKQRGLAMRKTEAAEEAAANHSSMINVNASRHPRAARHPGHLDTDLNAGATSMSLRGSNSRQSMTATNSAGAATSSTTKSRLPTSSGRVPKTSRYTM